jgi:hypothetical protein
MTPTRPVQLRGQMYRRVAREAIDPLTLTALALEGGEPKDCAMIISCDLVGVSDELQQLVRKQLAPQLPEVPPEKVVMVATHTHTSLFEGPSDERENDEMTPAECAALITDRAVEAAVEAWARRAPHTLGVAFEHAVVGHNRRAAYADGSSQMYGQTDRKDFVWIEGYEDHSLDVIFTWDASGKLTGVVLDIPCPAQVDADLKVVSADYWHDIRVQLRTRLGDHLQVLPLCGVAGDQSPWPLIYRRQEEEMRRRRGISERQEIGIRVADAVMRALACTRPATGDIAFAHAVKHLKLAPREISRAERDWAEAEYARAIRELDPSSWYPQRLKAVVDSFDRQEQAERLPVEVHVLRMGDVAVATNPFELYLDYALRIKARSPAAQTLAVQLASGIGGYLPTARAVAGGGYGAAPSSTVVGPTGGQELVEATLEMIRSLFPSETQAP